MITIVENKNWINVLTIFPARLTFLRHKSTYTNYGLAKAIGVKADTIAKYQRGESIPSVKHMVALALEFKCSVDYLLGFGERE